MPPDSRRHAAIDMTTTPTPQRKGCGCCGCPGCLLGCVFFLIVIPGILAALIFFSGGVGENVDRATIYMYRNFGRSAILESASIKGDKQDKEQLVQLIDFYLAAYQQLPAEERQNIRKELIVVMTYEARGENPPKEKIQHLDAFINSQVERLKQQYPLPPDAAPPP